MKPAVTLEQIVSISLSLKDAQILLAILDDIGENPLEYLSMALDGAGVWADDGELVDSETGKPVSVKFKGV